jgi:hypothetical protein
MNKSTVGAIYAIKNGEGNSYKERLAKFMSSYTDTPIEYYNDDNLSSIMSSIFAKLLDHVEYPSTVFIEYYRWKQYPWNYNDFDAMCAAMSSVQVKRLNKVTNQYEYINGFWDIEKN